MSIKIIKERHSEYRGSPAVGQCHCGREVLLDDPLDNVCNNCGRCYNMSGQEVTPSWDCDEEGNPYAEP